MAWFRVGHFKALLILLLQCTLILYIPNYFVKNNKKNKTTVTY